MRMFRTLLISLGLCSCAGVAENASSERSWCFQQHEQGAREPLSPSKIQVVSPGMMKKAVSLLERNTVVRLDYDTARQYAPGLIIGNGTLIYLVRGSVATRPGLDKSRVIMEAKSAKFDLLWSKSDNTLAVFVSQSVDGPRQNNNIALLIETNKPVSYSYLGCFVTD